MKNIIYTLLFNFGDNDDSKIIDLPYIGLSQFINI